MAAVTHGNAGGSETLVATPSTTTVASKGLTAGTGISLGSNASAVTITNSDPASGVTLTNAGTTTLVNDGTGPSLATKGLVAGTGISFSTSATDVTITNSDPASGVTLTSAGGTETLVNDGTGPALATKGLTAGANITLTGSATAVTIAYATPICRVTQTAPPAITTSTTPTLLWNSELLDPTGMHSTSMNTERINILVTGIYHLFVSMQFVTASAPTGAVIISIARNSGGATTIAAVGSPININGNYIWTASCVLELLSSDYVYVVFQNGTNVTCTPSYAANWTPIFCVTKIGEV